MFKIGDDARRSYVDAIEKIAEAVGSTLGPGGRPFGYDKFNMYQQLSPSMTKDGLTVLKALKFRDDPVMSATLAFAKQASMNSVYESGDGTTSTIIIASEVARAILNSNEKFPQAFAREIKADTDACIDAIKSEAITTESAIRTVAMTSSNGDEELADVVIRAINQSSAFGTLLVERNPLSRERYTISKQDGYGYLRGYNYHQILGTSADPAAASNRHIHWKNPLIVTFNGALISLEQIKPITDTWLELSEDRNLVILAYEVTDEVANKLAVLNRKIEGSGNSRKIMAIKPKLVHEINSGLQILRDVSAYAGIKEEKIVDGGNKITFDSTWFGTVKEIKIGPNETIIIGRADNHWVDERIAQNASIVENATVQIDKDMTSIRNAELSEGLVKVIIGDGSMPDLEERSDRFDDASKAAKACMKNGALPGGGFSYIRSAIITGAHPALKQALYGVYKRVMENYGSVPNMDIVPARGRGYKITKDAIEYGDAEELGVLDSCDTVCSVLKNGVDLGVKLATSGGFFFRTEEPVSLQGEGYVEN